MDDESKENHSEFSLFSGIWSRLGFRGSDPTVDLRGGGSLRWNTWYIFAKIIRNILFNVCCGKAKQTHVHHWTLTLLL